MKKKILVAIVLVVAMVVAGGSYLVHAIWNQEEAVHIVAKDMENGTLIIGTHLIHLSALTDELYAKAVDSASLANQQKRYYKSEVAGGSWYDITNGSSMEDIQASGILVPDAEIEALFLEFHTGSDGITIDLRTKAKVNIFDISDPYDIQGLPEMEPLKLQFDLLEEKEKLSDSESWAAEQIGDLFSLDLGKTSATYEEEMVSGSDLELLDLRLSGLDWYLGTQNEREMDGNHTGVTMEVSEAVDAERRQLVMKLLSVYTGGLLEDISGASVLDGMPEEYETPTDAVDAAGESISNVNTSITTYGGLLLVEGDSTLTKELYKWQNQLIQDAEGSNRDACDNDVEEILRIQRLLDGTLGTTGDEDDLAMVLGLMESALNKLEATATAGEDEAYKVALADGKGAGTLDSICNNNSGKVAKLLAEAEFMVSSALDLANQDKSAEILANMSDRLDKIAGKVPGDAFSSGVLAVLGRGQGRVSDMETVLESQNENTELNQLNRLKDNLMVEMMSCLDMDDLEGADEYQKLISEIDDKLAALGGEGGEIGSLVAGIEQDAKQALAEGDTEGVSTAIGALDGLMDLDFATVFPAVKELRDQVILADNTGAGLDGADDLIEALDTMILENTDSYKAAVSNSQTMEDILATVDQILELGLPLDGDKAGDGSGLGLGDGKDDGGLGLGLGDGEDDDGLGLGLGDGEDDDGLGLGLGDGEDDDDSGLGRPGDNGKNAALQALFDLIEKDPSKGVVISAACSDYLDIIDNEAVRSLMNGIANQMYVAGCPAIYERVADISTQYIPLPAIGYLTGMRYYWDRAKSEGLLSYANTYYTFKMFYDKVETTGGEILEMAHPTDFKQHIHIPEETALGEFGCEAVYLDSSIYAVAFREPDRALVDELVNGLLEGGL